MNTRRRQSVVQRPKQMALVSRPQVRPFFGFYGGKWRDALKHYPEPAHRTVVEPFAGSAGYSLRHADRQVVLCELDPILAAVWTYLIRVKPSEIRSIPDIPLDGSVDDLNVCEEARWLVGFWLNRGIASPRLAFVLLFYDWDWAGAERAYRRALELNLGNTNVRSGYATLLGMVGRVDESVAEARSAVERDPVSANCRYCLAHVLTLARRFEEVVAEANAGIEFDPSFNLFYSALGLGLAGLGRLDETVEVSRQGTDAAPGVPVMQAQLGWALGLAQHRQEALTVLEDLERRRSQDYVGGVSLAWVCVGLGRPRPSYRMAAASG